MSDVASTAAVEDDGEGEGRFLSWAWAKKITSRVEALEALHADYEPEERKTSARKPTDNRDVLIATLIAMVKRAGGEMNRDLRRTYDEDLAALLKEHGL